MPKFILSPLTILLWLGLSAQIPSGYYSTATGSGYTLKSNLHNIIDNHNSRTYGDLWDFMSSYDLDSYYENDGTILDIYSEKPTGSDPYNFTKVSGQCGTYANEGDCYNREHSFPKSWFNDGYPMYTDIHHLYPTDGKVNGYRSNFPYGEVGSASFTSENGSKLGSARSGLGYSGTVFEPIDEFKGDLARSYFYMATRYEDIISGWSSAMLDGSNDQVYENWAVEMLISWHLNDPVSQKEIDRNNNAYTFQGNRNPYVDHPEWVNQIWGDGIVTPIVTTSQVSLDFGSVNVGSSSSSQSYAVNGTDLASDVIVVVSSPFELSTDNTNWLNEITISQANVEAGINNLVYIRFSPTVEIEETYSQSISHSATNATTVSIAVSGSSTVQSVSYNSSSVFFSEYIEGSSNNKALEIYNGKSFSIDLSDYKIVQGNNGNTLGNGNGVLIDAYEVTLSGTLAAGEVYVIANGAASSTITNVANLLLTYGDNSGDRVISFNGNDAIGLYENGVLIDLIGVNGNDPGSSWTSGSHSTVEQTLVRKANIRKGNSNGFEPISTLETEWDVYSQNYSDDLGSHTFTPQPLTFTWTGETSSAWELESNWNQSLIPLPIDGVIVTDVINQPVISTDISIDNIVLETSANLIITSGASLAIMGSVSGSGTVEIQRNTTGNLGYSIVGSPVSNANLTDLQADFIYDFNGTNFFTPSGAMTPGKGYFVAYDETSPTITLSGTPNFGEIIVPVSSSGDGFNIVANPYAAAINRADFIYENANDIDGNIWLWDDGGTNEGNNRGGDYVVVNNIGSTSLVNLAGTGQKGSSAFNGNIGSMQGFLVKASSNSQVIFKPAMQNAEPGINDDSHFYRKEESHSQTIKLSISGNGLYNELIVGLSESATFGMDYAMDAPKYSVNKDISFYSLLDENRLAIQALPNLENDSIEIPIGFDLSESGSFLIQVSSFQNFQNHIEVHILDAITGISHNLKETDSFDFQTSASVDNRRFTLVFSRSMVLTNKPLQNPSIRVSGVPSALNVIFDQNGSQDLTIYTIDGKMIFQNNIEFKNHQATISADIKRNQLYLMRVGSESVKFILK